MKEWPQNFNFVKLKSKYVFSIQGLRCLISCYCYNFHLIIVFIVARQWCCLLRLQLWFPFSLEFNQNLWKGFLGDSFGRTSPFWKSRFHPGYWLDRPNLKVHNAEPWTSSGFSGWYLPNFLLPWILLIKLESNISAHTFHWKFCVLLLAPKLNESCNGFKPVLTVTRS